MNPAFFADFAVLLCSNILFNINSLYVRS